MNGLSTLMTFSEEQGMLLEVADSFCRDKSPVSAVRKQLASEAGFDHSLWDEMVGLGWSGIAIPEQYGGSGLSLAEVATITEPMGRHLMATPYVSTQLFIQGLLAGGSEAQKIATLGKVCRGAIATVAVFERDGDWNLCEIDSSAVVTGAVVNLAGAKTLVGDAGVAEFFLVSVSLAGEPALVLLSSQEISASQHRREIVIDETRRSYRMDLNGLSVPVTSLITGPSAVLALNAIRDTGLLLASAEAAGGIAGALDVIVAYLNLRTTFGRKIGSYQALKHTSAEILIGLERSRSHLYHAASLLAAGQEAEVALRMAKVESSDSFAFAGDRGVQFHGGFGFTYECDAQLYLRRALWLQYRFGDATHHRRRLADRLLASPF